MSKYKVEVVAQDEWTFHSDHDSYRSAIDQSHMVRGRVVCSNGVSDYDAYKYASSNQGFDGSFDEWQSQDDEERDAYEVGAGGVGTV